MATLPARAMCVLWSFEAKSVIKMQRRYRTQHGKDQSLDNAVTFGDGYSVKKQHFTHKGG
jgi:hypothetical protein